jgi:D-amino-acid dehydrogenase
MTVAVVGGGIVGLCCAWHLQERGIPVVVIDRDRIGAGACWGNAGHVAPALAVPLPEPAAVVAGIRSLVDPRSPVLLPKLPRAELARFLAAFLRHSTHKRWLAGCRAMVGLSAGALAEFDRMGLATVEAPFTALMRRPADGAAVLAEIAGSVAGGLPVDFDFLTAAETVEAEPLAADALMAVRINGQRMVDPPVLLRALAESVRARGAEFLEGAAVTGIARHNGRIKLSTVDAEFDSVVLATGAALTRLAGGHGVRIPMYAGRGYSFSVETPVKPGGMINFPAVRIACVPLDGRLRVTSLMELWPADAPPVERHARRFMARARAALPSADWNTVAERWVGARPLTADGLPVLGRTNTEGVYVAGGHGMWGLTLAPVSGRLIAELIETGRPDPALTPFDPLRR